MSTGSTIYLFILWDNNFSIVTNNFMQEKRTRSDKNENPTENR